METHRYKSKLQNETGTAEQSTKCENTQAQQNKVQNGKTQMYGRTKYRTGKHTSTAELCIEWEKHKGIKHTGKTKYRVGKHTHKVQVEQSTERENTQVQQS